MKRDVAREPCLVHRDPEIVQHPLAGEEACCLHLFFPHLDDLHVDKVEDAKSAVLITARSRAAEASCHRCGLWSARVHSRYRRRLHDLAGHGLAARLQNRSFGEAAAARRG